MALSQQAAVSDLADHLTSRVDDMDEAATVEWPIELERLLVDGGVPADERHALAAAAGHPARYVRVRAGASVDMAALAVELGCELSPVPYLPRYFRLSVDRGIAMSSLYRQGLIFGGDVSSGVAVASLGIQPGDDCLDLCCAPGVKLALMAENAAPAGSVTGVDLDRTRLASCRTLVKKYRLPRVRLYRCDGRLFDVDAPPLASRHASTLSEAVDRVGQPTKPFHAARFLRGCPDRTGRLYDRVLVDAECTHDGSVRHLGLAHGDRWQTFLQRGLDPDRVQGLPTLQLGLLAAGFRLLRDGGSLVYATCSLTRTQNENVIAAFLAQTPSARLVPTGIDTLPLPCYIPWSSTEQDAAAGRVQPHILRMDQLRSGTSSLFVAKLTKVGQETDTLPGWAVLPAPADPV